MIRFKLPSRKVIYILRLATLHGRNSDRWVIWSGDGVVDGLTLLRDRRPQKRLGTPILRGMIYIWRAGNQRCFTYIWYPKGNVWENIVLGEGQLPAQHACDADILVRGSTLQKLDENTLPAGWLLCLHSNLIPTWSHKRSSLETINSDFIGILRKILWDPGQIPSCGKI